MTSTFKMRERERERERAQERELDALFCSVLCLFLKAGVLLLCYVLVILAQKPVVLFGTKANNADPDQTLQKAASDQGFHSLLTY